MPTPPVKFSFPDTLDNLLRQSGLRTSLPAPAAQPPVPLRNKNTITINPHAATLEELQRAKQLGDLTGEWSDAQQAELDQTQKHFDLYDVLLGKLQGKGPQAPGTHLGANLLTAAQHPLESGKGVVDAVEGFVNAGLLEPAKSALQAVSPYDLNKIFAPYEDGSKHFPEYVPYNSDKPGEFVSGRLGQAVGAVPFLGPMAMDWKQLYNRQLEAKQLVPGDKDPEVYAQAAAGATGEFLANLAAPLEPVLGGTVPDGKGGTKPAEARDITKGIADILLLAKGGHILGRTLGIEGPDIINTLEGDMVSKKLGKLSQSSGEIGATDYVESILKQQIAAKYGKTEAPSPLKPAAEVVPTPEEQVTGTPGGVSAEAAKPVATEGASKTAYPIVDPARAAEAYSKIDERLQPKVEMLAEPELVKQLQADIILDPLRADAALGYMKSGDPPMLAMTKVLDDPTLTKVVLPDQADFHGADPADLRTAYASSFERAGHMGGQTLQSFSQVLDELDAKYLAKAVNSASLTDMLAAQKQLKTIQEFRRATASGALGKASAAAQRLQSMTKKVQGFERLRIGYMLAKLPTAINIAKAQGITSITDMFDALNTGLVATAGSVAKGEGVGSLDRNWADFASQLVSIRSMLDGKTNEILDANPMIKGRLMTGLLSETDTHLGFFSANANRMIQNAREAPAGQRLESLRQDYASLKGAGHFDINKPGQAIYDTAMLGADLATLPLRFQEQIYRKYSFRARLEANLKHIGLTLKDAIEQSKSAELLDAEGNVIPMKQTADGTFVPDVPEGTNLRVASVRMRDPRLQEALVDAETHALRQTWAATPEGLFGASMKALQMYNSISPVPTTFLFTPFVRSMMNNMMWHMHHSPAGIVDFFSKDFQEAWKAPLKDKLTSKESRDAQRRMGESLTGLEMLVAGMHMAQGGQVMGYKMGAQPWLWTTGTNPDGSEDTFDIRNKGPLAQYALVGKLMDDALQGREFSVSLQDAASILNNMQLSQVPIFNFETTLRNLASKNDETAWKAASKDLGNMVAPFGNLVKTFREDYGRSILEAGQVARFGDVRTDRPSSPDYTQPSIAASPLTGGLVAGLRPKALPEKYDPFTGRLAESPSSLEDLTVGSPRRVTQMQRALEGTPDMNPSMITRRYSSPIAQELVNKHMGQLLNNSDVRVAGQTIEEYMKTVNSYKDPVFTKQVLDQLLPTLHDAAEGLALQEDLQLYGQNGVPPHFLDSKLLEKESGLGGAAPAVREYWQQLLRERFQQAPSPIR